MLGNPFIYFFVFCLAVFGILILCLGVILLDYYIDRKTDLTISGHIRTLLSGEYLHYLAKFRLKIGDKVFVKRAGHYHIGEIIEINKPFIIFYIKTKAYILWYNIGSIFIPKYLDKTTKILFAEKEE